MLKVEVKVDMSKLITGFRQVPFATALALTRTAQDAQLEVRRQLPQRFTIRNNFVSQGIRIVPATKTTLEAAVLSRDDFMVRQEKGGTKTPKDGRSIAVPENVRVNKRGIVTRANRPRQLLDKPRTFIATIRGVRGIWQRQTKNRTPLRLLYALVPLVRVRPRFGFEETIRKVVTSRFARQFQVAFLQALRTAR
jgi:hypothetical protein